jgi:hypothetical protein
MSILLFALSVVLALIVGVVYAHDPYSGIVLGFALAYRLTLGEWE